MKLPLTGGCRCSALRYKISRAPGLVYTCHCTECQRQTGSAFSMGVVLETEEFILSGARPRPIQRTADSGRTVTRWVCPECGSWICNGPDPTSTAPGERRVVRAGTLDDTSWLPRRCISGRGARSRGSRSPKGTGGSRGNPRLRIGRGPDQGGDRAGGLTLRSRR